MSDPILALKVNSDNKNSPFLVVLVWVRNQCFHRFSRGWVEVVTPQHKRTDPRRAIAKGDTRKHSRERNLGSPPRGPLDLRIRPRRFPAMQDPIPALKISSDTKNVQFSMILVTRPKPDFHC